MCEFDIDEVCGEGVKRSRGSMGSISSKGWGFLSADVGVFTNKQYVQKVQFVQRVQEVGDFEHIRAPFPYS